MRHAATILGGGEDQMLMAAYNLAQGWIHALHSASTYGTNRRRRPSPSPYNQLSPPRHILMLGSPRPSSSWRPSPLLVPSDDAASQFRRAIIMPNLVPPISTVEVAYPPHPKALVIIFFPRPPRPSHPVALLVCRWRLPTGSV